MFNVTIIKLKDIIKIGVILILIYVFSNFILKTFKENNLLSYSLKFDSVDFVKKGIEKAHELHLPQQIVNIISEHHGNSVIAYFYNEAKEKDPTLTPETFTYTGNPPSTRESAVVMLADTVEAACRTLENPSVTRLEKFIQTLINSKVELT